MEATENMKQWLREMTAEPRVELTVEGKTYRLVRDDSYRDADYTVHKYHYEPV